MSLETTLAGVLVADAGVTALAGDRVRPVSADQDDAVPYAVYDILSCDPVNGLDGYHNLALYRVQITAWASTRESAAALTAAMVDALAAANTAGTLRSRWEEQRDQPFEIATRQFGIATDFMVWFRS